MPTLSSLSCERPPAIKLPWRATSPQTAEAAGGGLWFRIERVTGEPLRRYEHGHPGSLIHVDVTS
jgi:hypothetical protein